MKIDINKMIVNVQFDRSEDDSDTQYVELSALRWPIKDANDLKEQLKILRPFK